MRSHIRLFLAVVIVVVGLPLSGFAAEGEAGAPAEQVDAIHILPISSIALGKEFECLVFLPGALDQSEPVPALIVFPDDVEQVQILDDAWSGGDVPKTANMIILVPRIDPNLPQETVFSLFSEVMFAGNETYRLDPSRIYLWGVGAGARHAFFAARSLPEKFAAVVDFPDEVFRSGSLLDFATLESSLQVEAVRAAPSTYEGNMHHVATVADSRKAESLAIVESDYWGAISEALLHHKAEDGGNGIRYRTDRLRFSKHSYLQIINFQNWSLPAGIKADTVSDNGQLICRTENLSMLSITIPDGIDKLDLDEDRFNVEPGRTYTFQQRRRWREIGPPAVVVTRKNPDCAGPLADALITPFVFVVGTQGDNSEVLKAWAEMTAQHLGLADVRIVTDQEVMDDEDLQKNYSLICFGGSADNRVSNRVSHRDMPGLSFEVSKRDLVHTGLRPSPFAIDRYLVINEPLGESGTQGPARLRWYADWAVYRSSNGAPVAVGSFDSDWRPESFPDDPWQDFRH